MVQAITPEVCVHDPRAAIDWYRDHFGATVTGLADGDSGISHATLDVAGAVFVVSGEAPSSGVRAPRSGGVSVSIVLLVAAVEAFVERAIAGGAVLERPITEGSGTRNAWLIDPFGHRWNIGTPLPRPARARPEPAEPYYLTVTSPDVERAAAFYGAVLGWEFGPPKNGGRHVINTRQPIGVRPPENPFSRSEPGEVMLWWIARDFDATLDRVRSAGGTVVSVTPYDSGREAVCRDDQGVEFRLSEPAPGYDPGPVTNERTA